MLLLSWIAQGGGRGVVTLDLLNCIEVRLVASPTSAQDDVGTIAAKAQTANALAEGFRELGLLETLCPFQLFYGDGVERLGHPRAPTPVELLFDSGYDISSTIRHLGKMGGNGQCAIANG